MKTTLYDIADSYQNFMQMVENGEIEDEQVIADTLDSINQEFDAKVDNIACLFKSISAEADAIEAEAKRLIERAHYKRNVCDRLKAYVSAYMQVVGKDKFENERNRVSFSKSQALDVLDEQTLIASLNVAGREDLYRVEEVVKVDKAGIKKAIKDGASFAGCEVKTNKNIQIK